MEPVLCEGDLIEVGAVDPEQAREGAVYCFRMGHLDRPAAHRLVEKGELFRFQGDRQPFVETIPPPDGLFEVRRVLERARTPDAETLLFSILLLAGRPGLIFPGHCTLYWPWETLLQLGQQHRLNAMLVHVLKTTGLWSAVPPALRGPFESAFHEAVARGPLIDIVMGRVAALLPNGRLLKGAWMRELYPQPWLRLMEDVDVLVAPDDFDPAIAHLRKNGFSLSAEASEIAKYYTSVTLLHEETGVGVDLHKAPFQPKRFRFDSAKLLRESCAELDFVYMAAHLFQHWGRHGQGLLDLKLFQTKRKVDLIKAFELSRECGAQASFLFACRQLYRWFNMPMPDLSDLPVPMGIRLRLACAEEFHGHDLRTGLYTRKKRLLQFLLSDSVLAFWRLYRDPARRRMIAD